MKDIIKTQDIKIRKSWGKISPETKIEKVKTDYSRKDNKQAIREALDEMEADLEYDE
jgi:hypothetical protein